MDFQTVITIALFAAFAWLMLRGCGGMASGGCAGGSCGRRSQPTDGGAQAKPANYSRITETEDGR